MTPKGHRCADAEVGAVHSTLTPDDNGCTEALHVCNPSGLSSYNNVLKLGTPYN